MASRIQGITVEIGGNPTKLSSALSGVNKEIKNTQIQLKDVEKLLKLDPSNTELVTQKQRLLKEAIAETKTKLDTLKTAAEQANEQLQKGEITQEQYDALQREIQETEQTLKALETQAASTNATLAKIEEVSSKMEAVGDNLKETPEGVSEMCKEMELMRDKSRAEGEMKGKRDMAINLHQMNNMTAEQIAKVANVSIEIVKQWLTPVSAELNRKLIGALCRLLHGTLVGFFFDSTRMNHRQHPGFPAGDALPSVHRIQFRGDAGVQGNRESAG